ncbi:hypothetical protein DFA_09072 [Cavenderia fasciculata]|uniref:Chitin-binding type-4 domain-containing protein n=1 Tax=Cavenderia fasciculata TaxID=261658 RepID=F4Q6L8_CACFS|nr:uncharacterized protein DFA_09072 [Cavenderia fasciculata]EGG16528.1 hypothetical protein DFA_09072 [Cavenderia fasciculata]|eukprot:XP_004354928.1 hypothetical protein DFA_09072 [Cavenderia fasciculata]
MKIIIILLITTILLLLQSLLIEGHSFMKCVNFDYNQNRCTSFPRNWQLTDQQGDRFLFQRGKFTKPAPTQLGQACGPFQRINTSPIQNQYDARYPMGQFYPGQQICSQWPARNHATQIRAGEVKIYLSNQRSGMETQDDSQETFFSHPVATSRFGNCSDYLKNTNDATCTACYNVPSTPGKYVLQWFWEFNAQEYYMTCADIEIDAKFANGNNYQPQRYQAPQQQQQQQYQAPQQQYQAPKQQYQAPKQQTPQYQAPQQQQQYQAPKQQYQAPTNRKVNFERGNEVDLLTEGVVNYNLVDKSASYLRPSVSSFLDHQVIEIAPLNNVNYYLACQNGDLCFNKRDIKGFKVILQGERQAVSNLAFNIVSSNNEASQTFPMLYPSQEWVDDNWHVLFFPSELITADRFKGVMISGLGNQENSRHVYIDRISFVRNTDIKVMNNDNNNNNTLISTIIYQETRDN